MNFVELSREPRSFTISYSRRTNDYFMEGWYTLSNKKLKCSCGEFQSLTLCSASDSFYNFRTVLHSLGLGFIVALDLFFLSGK